MAVLLFLLFIWDASVSNGEGDGEGEGLSDNGKCLRV
jgi:hypothetical protein